MFFLLFLVIRGWQLEKLFGRSSGETFFFLNVRKEEEEEVEELSRSPRYIQINILDRVYIIFP